MRLVALDDRFGGQVASCLGAAPVGMDVHVFEGGEFRLRVLENVRSCDVYVVQTLHGADLHEKLVRLLFLAASLRDQGAARVTAVVPHLCYGRQDRRTHAGDPLPTRYVAQLLEAAGVGRLVTMDVHDAAAFENAFRIPTVQLSAARWLAEALAPTLGDRVCVVSPDAGGMKRADRFRLLLQKVLQRDVSLAVCEKHRSDESLSGGLLAGDVEGRDCVLFDDMIDTGRTLARAASACLSRGGGRVFAAATHGFFHDDAGATLLAAGFEGIWVADTVPPARLPGVTVVPVAEVFASEIRAGARPDPGA